MIQLQSNGWFWLFWLLIILLILIFILFLRRKIRDQQRIIYEPADESELGRGTLTERFPLLHKKSSEPFKSRIRILKRRDLQSRITSPSDFESLVLEEGCIKLNMKKLWEDTIIDEIYLTIDFRLKLSEYLDSFMDNSSGIDIEVGGFLLGRYTFDQEAIAYKVILGTFVPIESAGNHHLHLEFNTQSLSAELGDAQDRYPDLVVVGWFHTHPGHGLFLSKADLAIQQGFFTEQFQFAMEIDSLTDEFDLGFFTYRKNGDINNRPQSPTWFSWREIEATL